LRYQTGWVAAVNGGEMRPQRHGQGIVVSSRREAIGLMIGAIAALSSLSSDKPINANALIE
jgi:hypothetical protein